MKGNCCRAACRDCPRGTSVGFVSRNFVATESVRRRDIKAGLFVPSRAGEGLTPFKIQVPQTAWRPEKKKRAPHNTRWPDKETVGDWVQGVHACEAKALTEYWRTKLC